MELANQIIGLLMVAVPLIVGAAAIVWRMHGRKQIYSLLVLGLFPLLLMGGVLVLGAIFSPAHDSGFSNLAFAVMLIGIFAVIPWMAACTIGFFIGGILRRRHPPPEPVPAASTAPATQVPTLSRPAPAIIPADISQPAHQEFSPDGSVRVDIHPVEWASSQFAATPRVVRVSDGQILCNMLGTDWDVQVSYPREAYIWLGLRRYCSPGYLFAEFDLAADRYRIATTSLDAPDEEGPLGDVTDRLEFWWDKASATAASRIMEAQPQLPPKPHPFAAWRTALVILVGTLAAIAGLTYMSEKTGIDPPRLPTGAPHIPRFPR